MPATVSEQEAYQSTFDEFRRCVDDPKITVAEITHQHAEKFAEYMRGQSLAILHGLTIRGSNIVERTFGRGTADKVTADELIPMLNESLK